jgi:hypothetical protein
MCDLRACLHEKTISPWLLRILGFSLVESVMGPSRFRFGLHEGSFGLQPITVMVYEKTTWNPTWQVWIMLAEIVGGIFLG